VISSIVHITHKYDNDSEPWPIQIEDHNGRLHSVSLQEGQVLYADTTIIIMYCTLHVFFVLATLTNPSRCIGTHVCNVMPRLRYADYMNL
jgi:hypothetical protein